ncbi:hypothetical protein GCM10027425_30560 [Alteromonas gracilis]
MSLIGPTATMRDHGTEERAATPLELAFDLCFVVAVAFLAAELHHGLADGHAWTALATYALLFVPIWWAWMSYTWFATSFSHDDRWTRILTFAQMGGILAVAAAIPAAADGDLLPFAAAYALMRVPLILQWLRSAAADPVHRAFAGTYAAGSAVAQALWVLGALLGGLLGAVVFVMALGVELGTPMRAVRRAPGRVFHARHIAERYGLFTIIVLGETVLAVSVGLREVLERGLGAQSVVLVAGALVSAAALWWVYFAALSTHALVRNRAAAFVWGYGHYVVFAAIAAIGAGVRAEIDVAAGIGHAHGHAGAATVAAGVAVTLVSLAVLARVADPGARVAALLTCAVVLLLVAAVLPGALGSWTVAVVAVVTVVAARVAGAAQAHAVAAVEMG